MSMQEINLYLPELRPKKQSFTAAFGAYSCAALIVVLSVVYGVSSKAVADLSASVEEIENQQVASSERVLKIKKQSLSSNALQLDKRIQQLRVAIEDRALVGDILEWQNLGNEDGFATILESLSRHSNSQFSLQHIRISKGGKILEFSGEMQHAEAIPLYLQRLQADASLANTRFGLLSMSGKNKRQQFSLGFETVYTLAEGEK